MTAQPLPAASGPNGDRQRFKAGISHPIQAGLQDDDAISHRHNHYRAAAFAGL